MSIREHAASLLTAIAGAALGAVIVDLAGLDSAADAALPLWIAVSLLSVALAPRGLARSAGTLALPLLLAVAVTVPDADSRHLGYGLVVAASVGAAAAAAAERGRIAFRTASALLLLILAVRLVPLDPRSAAALAVIAAAGVLLLHSLSAPPLFRNRGSEESLARPSWWPGGREDEPPEPRSVPVGAFLLTAALTAIAPAEPWKGALTPLAAAALVAAMRSGAIVTWGGAVGIALLVGRWAVAAVVLAAGASLVTGWMGRGSRAVVVPTVWLGSARAAGAALAFSPASIGDLAGAPLGRRIAAFAILLLSLFARPFPSLALALTALLLVAGPHGPAGRRLASIPAALGSALLCFAAWSGIFDAGFPALIPTTAWIALAAGGALAVLVPRLVAGALLAGALGAGVVAFALVPPGAVLEVGAMIAPGESVVLVPPARSDAVEIVMSGANVSNLGAGAPVARLRILGEQGEAWSRQVTIGEIADWAAFRSGNGFWTRNPVPRRPAWRIEGGGRSAFIRGEGRVAVRASSSIRSIEVRAAGNLPPDARILIESLEVPRR